MSIRRRLLAMANKIKNLIPDDDPANPAKYYYCTSTGTVAYSDTEQAFFHQGSGIAYSAQSLNNGTKSMMFIAPHDMSVKFSIDYKNVGTTYGIRLYSNNKRIHDIHGSADGEWHTHTYTINLSTGGTVNALYYSNIYWRNQTLVET